MNECGGVLVPDGDGWRRTCFVEERGLVLALADVVYADGRRPLQITSDHYFPVSRWPSSARLHTAHLYCQMVQGRRIGNQARLGTKMSDETKTKMSTSAKEWAGTADGKAAKARAGLAAIAVRIASRQYQSEPYMSQAVLNLDKGRCLRWNIQREKQCICGQHKGEK